MRRGASDNVKLSCLPSIHFSKKFRVNDIIVVMNPDINAFFLNLAFVQAGNLWSARRPGWTDQRFPAWTGIHRKPWHFQAGFWVWSLSVLPLGSHYRAYRHWRINSWWGDMVRFDFSNQLRERSDGNVDDGFALLVPGFAISNEHVQFSIILFE